MERIRPLFSEEEDRCCYRFHTKERQDFYETVLLDKKPIVSDMRWVDCKFVDANEENFPNVHENFKTLNIDKFVCEVRSDYAQSAHLYDHEYNNLLSQ